MNTDWPILNCNSVARKCMFKLLPCLGWLQIVCLAMLVLLFHHLCTRFTAGDTIIEHFGGANGERMRRAYGIFCSRHKEAIEYYKHLYKADRKFQSFIKVSRITYYYSRANHIVYQLIGLHVKYQHFKRASRLPTIFCKNLVFNNGEKF